MQEGFVSYGSSSIHYSCWGTGDKLLLCFHGYGETAASFAFLNTALGREFTILAPDMPFHGGTVWNGPLFFDPGQLPGIIEKILTQLTIAPDRWWVLGYSMGGRIALSLLQTAPEKIVKLILLAPDGIKINGWYRFATQSRPGNGLFHWAMQNPSLLFFFLRIAEKAKWINPGIHNFILKYLDDARARDELYKRWTVMKGFRPDIPIIRSIIREKHIAVRLLYGRHDRIVPPGSGEEFRKGIEDWCSLTVMDAGHGLLQTRQKEVIGALLKD